MEKALLVKKGKETLVSAFDVQADFGGRIPWGVSFICPFCRQPLSPTAMGFGGIQSPHFRHERNNERAHECEFFASRYGYYSTYQRAPMPMFIRRAKIGQSLFVVEGGFRFLGEDLISRMEAGGATLHIGQKKYRVTHQRFGSGLTKLPFEEISLNFGSIVRLSNSPVGLNGTWGYPEDARKAMVFTRDPESKQGKRVKMGDSIPSGSTLYLLAPEREEKSIRHAFRDARKVGYAGSRTSGVRHAVYEVDAPSNVSAGDPGVKYFEECGFEVSDIDEAPKLVWPPSLSSGGDILPLFKNSRFIFTVPESSSPDKKLYIHTANDALGCVRNVPLRRSATEGISFGILRNNASSSFVAAKDCTLSFAVLLHSDDSLLENIPIFDACLPVFEEAGDGKLRISLCAPGNVRFLNRGGEPKVVKVGSADASVIEFDRKSFEVVEVRQELGASLDGLVVFKNHSCDVTRGELFEDIRKSPREELLLLRSPNDTKRAVGRDRSSANRTLIQGGKRFADIRKDMK